MKRRQPAPRLDYKIDSDRQKLLKMQGVDGAAFGMLRQPFLLDDALVSITPYVPKWLPDDFDLPRTSVPRQVDALHRLLINPLHGRPIIGIGSMVSDDRAKFLAMQIMNAAITQHKNGSHKGKLLPLWHRVMGGYNDPLRDVKDSERPNISMLILTNVGVDSTPHKIEKIRDLLEIYDNIPRVVVMNGSDPISFFADKIRMSMQYAIFMDNKRSDKQDLLDSL